MYNLLSSAANPTLHTTLAAGVDVVSGVKPDWGPLGKLGGTAKIILGVIAAAVLVVGAGCFFIGLGKSRAGTATAAQPWTARRAGHDDRGSNDLLPHRFLQHDLRRRLRHGCVTHGCPNATEERFLHHWPHAGAVRVKLWGIAAGAVAAVTVAGLVVSLTTGSGSIPAPAASSPADSAPKTSEPRGRANSGVPVGYPRTEAGAKAAAANYTTVAGSSAYLTDKDVRHRAVSVMAANSSASAVLQQADRAASQAASDLKGDNRLDPKQAIARTGVLSSHTLGFDIHRSTIRLWTTTVRGSATGHAHPRRPSAR